MLTINAYQHIRFNIHTFTPANYKSPQVFRVFLKKDAGTLAQGDFMVGETASTFSLMPTRGRIVIKNTNVVIDAEIAQRDAHGEPNPTSWTKWWADGEYQLVRN